MAAGLGWRLDLRRLAFGVITLLLFPVSALHAAKFSYRRPQRKIFDAHMAQQMFAGGLKYCDELDGKSFYYQVRNRILSLEEYAHSMENLVKAQAFNPAKKRPWTLEDAKERWEEVKKQAQEDKQKCATRFAACRKWRNACRNCNSAPRRLTRR